MGAAGLDAKVPGRLECQVHEDFGGVFLIEPVKHPAQPVIVKMLGQHAWANQMFSGLADEELRHEVSPLGLEQVERGGDEAKTIEDEALEHLAAGDMLQGVGAQQPVYFFDQAKRVDDPGNDAKVVEVLDLDVRGERVHPTKILQALNLPAESGFNIRSGGIHYAIGC